MYVCLSVYDNFRKLLILKVLFGLRVHPEGIRVKFVSSGQVQGNRAKKRQSPYSRNVKKLRSAITPI